MYDVADPVASNLEAWQEPLQEVVSFFGPSKIVGGTDKLFCRKNILQYLKKMYIIYSWRTENLLLRKKY